MLFLCNNSKYSPFKSMPCKSDTGNFSKLWTGNNSIIFHFLPWIRFPWGQTVPLPRFGSTSLCWCRGCLVWYGRTISLITGLLSSRPEKVPCFVESGLPCLVCLNHFSELSGLLARPGKVPCSEEQFASFSYVGLRFHIKFLEFQGVKPRERLFLSFKTSILDLLLVQLLLL